MDYLWTPWRYAYVTGARRPAGCIFCEAPKQADSEAKIVYRGALCYVILNTFPYTSGHLMIVPYQHLDQLQKLDVKTSHELIEISQRMEGVLRETYRPDGINLGMNIGQAAGAGIADHVHMHMLPRWYADTNFMTTTAETRVLPEALETTYRKLREKLSS
jgi:ATP adenylyltransferase